MVKEITKIEKIDSSKIADYIVDDINDTIDYKIRNYLEQYHKLLNEGDIDDIMGDEEWYNTLLEDLINKMKC
jgi:hypothetical protein